MSLETAYEDDARDGAWVGEQYEIWGLILAQSTEASVLLSDILRSIRLRERAEARSPRRLEQMLDELEIALIVLGLYGDFTYELAYLDHLTAMRNSVNESLIRVGYNVADEPTIYTCAWPHPPEDGDFTGEVDERFFRQQLDMARGCVRMLREIESAVVARLATMRLGEEDAEPQE